MRWVELQAGDVLVDEWEGNRAYAVLSWERSEGGSLLVFTLIDLNSASVRKHTRSADIQVHRCYRVLRGAHVMQTAGT